MNIVTYGEDMRLSFCRELLLSSRSDAPFNITILPIPSTRDKKTVSGTDISLFDVAKMLSSGDLLVGYGIPQEILESLKSDKIPVLDLEADEEFLRENARLTADGTIGRILTESECAPSDLSVGIIGYGRIGRSLLNSLMFFGAKARVFSSNRTLGRKLCMIGVDWLEYSEMSERRDAFSGLDILINTAPAHILSEDYKERLGGVRIIELASGDNIPPGLNYERMAAIPARMYPKSAGYTVARAILRRLGEKGGACL